MMDGENLLLILRLISAVVLLALLGFIAYFLQQEVALAARSASGNVTNGFVRVLWADSREDRHPLRQVVSIGRTPGNTIVLDNSYTSAQHALITHRDTQWWIEDLGSRNGTLVNNIPVNEPTALSNGDVIAIGDVSITLEP